MTCVTTFQNKYLYIFLLEQKCWPGRFIWTPIQREIYTMQVWNKQIHYALFYIFCIRIHCASFFCGENSYQVGCLDQLVSPSVHTYSTAAQTQAQIQTDYQIIRLSLSQTSGCLSQSLQVRQIHLYNFQYHMALALV